MSLGHLSSLVVREIEDSIVAKQKLLQDAGLVAQLTRLAQDCHDSLKRGGKIIFAGNGGSFADAQHLSAEFVSRFRFDRAPLASLALATNSSAISAIGNDTATIRSSLVNWKRLRAQETCSSPSPRVATAPTY